MRIHSWAAVLAAGGMVVGLAAAEPGRPAAADAPKWEYKTLTREDVSDIGKADFDAGLNKLGDDGWELIAVEPRGRPEGWGTAGRTVLYFKRPAGRASASAPPGAADFKVFALKNAEAAAAAKAIDKMLGGAGAGVRLVADDRTNQLLVRGSAEDLITIAAILERLDVPSTK